MPYTNDIIDEYRGFTVYDTYHADNRTASRDVDQSNVLYLSRKIIDFVRSGKARGIDILAYSKSRRQAIVVYYFNDKFRHEINIKTVLPQGEQEIRRQTQKIIVESSSPLTTLSTEFIDYMLSLSEINLNEALGYDAYNDQSGEFWYDFTNGQLESITRGKEEIEIVEVA